MARPTNVFKRGDIWYYRGFRKRISLETTNKKEALKLKTIYDVEYGKQKALGKLKAKSTPLILSGSIKIYLSQHKAEHETRTTDNHRGRLMAFMNYAGDIDINKIDENVLKNYMSYRKYECNVSDRTIKNDMTSIKAMLLYYHRRGTIEKNPFMHIKLKNPKTTTAYLSLEQVEIITNLKYSKAEWVVQMVKIGLLTGLRPGELRSLRWDKINFSTGIIEVDGKMGKRIVPITPELEKILKEISYDLYGVRKYGWKDNYSKWVFHQIPQHKKSPNAINIIKKQLGETKFKKIIRAVFDHIGFPKNISAKSLRHTFGAQLYRSGMPLDKIQKFMGHTTGETTKIYAHITVSHEDLKNNPYIQSISKTIG